MTDQPSSIVRSCPVGRICLALSIFLVFGSACRSAAAADWFVDARSAASGSGSSTSPFSSIQIAIDKANPGDTIKVAAGSYKEKIKIRRKKLRLEGGYAADSSFHTRDSQKFTTTIEGDSSAPVVLIEESADTLIDGFRITGGQRGLFLNGGSPSVANCLIENNNLPGTDAKQRGGGICVDGVDSVSILNNVIRNNAAGRGAGVTVVHCPKATIAGNHVLNNTARGDHGGGFYLSIGDASITGNYIAGNTVEGWGGGVILFNKGFAKFSHNVYTNNYALQKGSALFIDEGAHALIENELIFANKCPSNGGAGIYVDSGQDGRGVATIRNCTIANQPCSLDKTHGLGGNGVLIEDSDVIVENSIFWGNIDDFYVRDNATLKVSYSLSSEKFDGPGNINRDPLFANLNANDYHLKSTAGRFDPLSRAFVLDNASSPAIDSGNPASGCPSEPAPNGERVDLGAYGNTSEASKSPNPKNCLPKPDSNPLAFPNLAASAPPLATSTQNLNPIPTSSASPPSSPSSAGGCGCGSGAASRRTFSALSMFLVSLAFLRRRGQPL